MKIQDVKGNGPSILMGDGLEQMFILRREIQSHYIDKEGLPPYPLDIQRKESQSLIRDFFYRILEELGEAYTEYVNMGIALQSPDTEAQSIALMDYNEELADVQNFMMQLMLYTNITTASIDTYYAKCLDEMGLKDAFYNPKNVLVTCFTVALEENLRARTAWGSFFQCYQVPEDIRQGNVLMAAGYKFTPELMHIHANKLWGIVSQITKAGNLLKNKAWRNQDTYTEGLLFQAEVIKIWSTWIHYLSFIGMEPKVLCSIYWKKAQVNLHRLKTDY